MIGDFDDDELFEKPKQPLLSDKCQYVAKCCDKEWYVAELPEASAEELVQRLKFRADRAYAGADYPTALSCYLRLQNDFWASLSIQMVREISESIGRCHLRSGDSGAALESALSQCRLSKNKEQKTCSWMFLAKVHRQLENHEDEVQTYVKLLRLHPLNAFFWSSFAEALALCRGLTSAAPVRGSGRPESTLLSDLDDDAVRRLVGACQIRVRILQESVERRNKTFGLSKYSGLLKKADDWLSVLRLPEGFEKRAAELLSRDVLREREEPTEFQDLGKSSHASQTATDDACSVPDHVRQFYDEWFEWMNTFPD